VSKVNACLCMITCPTKGSIKSCFMTQHFITLEFTWIGVALTLTYLHNDWEHCMVHQDVKVNNVMVDQNFNLALEILALLES
jgi:hypothetical protein